VARYIVTHTPGTETASQAEIYALLKGVAAANVEGAQWLGSWVTVDGGRMFCLWEADNEELIRTTLPPQVHEITPVENIYEVVPINPEDFR
jgi:hypothetical protein